MPQPIKGEGKDKFLQRCMADEESVNSFPDESQRFAVCQRVWETHSREALSLYKKSFAGKKISFDYDEVLSTQAGFDLAAEFLRKNETIYVISARGNKEPMLTRTRKLGIPDIRVYATGSNKAKVEKIKELGIETHYDNNKDVIAKLGSKGKLVKFAETYTDYPKAASENAKIALRWAEENGWGSCGTAVGKQRANQLAKNEPISEDTISRMASFERHRQNSQKELGDGCGRLMWLAWGGDEGIEWAQRKLEQIKNEK